MLLISSFFLMNPFFFLSLVSFYFDISISIDVLVNSQDVKQRIPGICQDPYQIQCGNGTCISLSKQRDCVQDCNDDIDEGCYKGYVRCDGCKCVEPRLAKSQCFSKDTFILYGTGLQCAGRVILEDWIYDGDVDCASGVDEDPNTCWPFFQNARCNATNKFTTITSKLPPTTNIPTDLNITTTTTTTTNLRSVTSTPNLITTNVTAVNLIAASVVTTKSLPATITSTTNSPWTATKNNIQCMESLPTNLPLRRYNITQTSLVIVLPEALATTEIKIELTSFFMSTFTSFENYTNPQVITHYLLFVHSAISLKIVANVSSASQFVNELTKWAVNNSAEKTCQSTNSDLIENAIKLSPKNSYLVMVHYDAGTFLPNFSVLNAIFQQQCQVDVIGFATASCPSQVNTDMVDISGGFVYLSGTVKNSLTIPNILATIVFEAVKTRIKLEIQEQRDSQIEHTFRLPIDDNSDQILFIIKGCDLNVTVTDNRGFVLNIGRTGASQNYNYFDFFQNYYLSAFSLGPLSTNQTCATYGPGNYIVSTQSTCKIRWKVTASAPKYYQYSFVNKYRLINQSNSLMQPANGVEHRIILSEVTSGNKVKTVSIVDIYGTLLSKSTIDNNSLSTKDYLQPKYPIERRIVFLKFEGVTATGKAFTRKYPFIPTISDFNATCNKSGIDCTGYGGPCVDKLFIHDCIVDCQTGADESCPFGYYKCNCSCIPHEAHCTTPQILCSPSSSRQCFNCTNGNVVPFVVVLNGNNDCEDWSDEDDANFNECNDGAGSVLSNECLDGTGCTNINDGSYFCTCPIDKWGDGFYCNTAVVSQMTVSSRQQSTTATVLSSIGTPSAPRTLSSLTTTAVPKPFLCPTNQFSCSTFCITIDDIMDGYVDCPDARDETPSQCWASFHNEKCNSSLSTKSTVETCPKGYVSCGQICIPVDYIMDGIKDCPNGIDEDAYYCVYFFQLSNCINSKLASTSKLPATTTTQPPRNTGCQPSRPMEQRQEDLHISPTSLVFVINEALLIEGVKEEMIGYFQKNRDTLNLTRSSTTIGRFLLFIHSNLDVKMVVNVTNIDQFLDQLSNWTYTNSSKGCQKTNFTIIESILKQSPRNCFMILTQYDKSTTTLQQVPSTVLNTVVDQKCQIDVVSFNKTCMSDVTYKLDFNELSGGTVYSVGNTSDNPLKFSDVINVIILEVLGFRITIDRQIILQSQLPNASRLHTIRIPVDENIKEILFIVRGCNVKVKVTDNRGVVINIGDEIYESIVFKTKSHLAFIIGPILKTPLCSWPGPGIYLLTIESDCEVHYKMVAMAQTYYQLLFSYTLRNTSQVMTLQPIIGLDHKIILSEVTALGNTAESVTYTDMFGTFLGKTSLRNFVTTKNLPTQFQLPASAMYDNIVLFTDIEGTSSSGWAFKSLSMFLAKTYNFTNLKSQCLSNQFDCNGSGGPCINKSLVNDCIIDCPNGADESCPYGTYKCNCSCIPLLDKCTPTSRDMCKQYKPNQCFNCSNGNGAPTVYLMDGDNDCGDWSDEIFISITDPAKINECGKFDKCNDYATCTNMEDGPYYCTCIDDMWGDGFFCNWSRQPPAATLTTTTSDPKVTGPTTISLPTSTIKTATILATTNGYSSLQQSTTGYSITQRTTIGDNTPQQSISPYNSLQQTTNGAQKATMLTEPNAGVQFSTSATQTSSTILQQPATLTQQNTTASKQPASVTQTTATISTTTKPTTKCPTNTYTCGQLCIDLIKVLDSYNDCVDGSDENPYLWNECFLGIDNCDKMNGICIDSTINPSPDGRFFCVCNYGYISFDGGQHCKALFG